MRKPIAALVGGVVLGLAVIGVVFLAGDARQGARRAQCRPPHRSRATKPLVLKSSGTPGGIASVIRHVGRTTGRPDAGAGGGHRRWIRDRAALRAEH